MARQPRQVHIYLYRRRGDSHEYAIFQRSDNPLWWQGICGGLEGRETIEEGARREISEEAGIVEALPLYRLDSVSHLPAAIFDADAQRRWGRDVVVVPMFFFAMPFEGEIVLSAEHTAVRWLAYEAAHALIYFADQKVALYELNERLARGNLIR